MANSLDKITIKGFKSIRSLENFELKPLNVLIGGNGAGKSNFIDFFRLLRAMMELPLPNLESTNLPTFIQSGGGCDDFLFNGPKVTRQIETELIFGENGYRFKLTPTSEETFLIIDEESYYKQSTKGWRFMGSGYQTPALLKEKKQPGVLGDRSVTSYIYESIDAWTIYHFHDTSIFAPMRRSETIHDYNYLRFDAANIAPYLFSLLNKHNNTYWQIVETIRLAAPFFGDFILQPDMNEKVRLLWKQKGSDYPLKPLHLSDGTLRFICLVTALLQPYLPSTIIIDEPELGLHPYAISVLAELIKATSRGTQLIICTQSPALVDNFDPEDIVVVNRENGASAFRRLDQKDLSAWLEDYSLGDLWQKNKYYLRGTCS